MTEALESPRPVPTTQARPQATRAPHRHDTTTSPYAVLAYLDASPLPSRIQRPDDISPAVAHVKNLIHSTVTELLVTVTVREDAGGWRAGHLLGGSWIPAGLTAKVLYHHDMRDDPAHMADAARLASRGFQARTTRNLPPVLIISDQQAALIPPGRDGPGDGAYCIGEPVVVAYLAALFTDAWEGAMPLHAHASAGGSPGISLREQALLKHLAAGLTVQAAARQLGISPRTAARLVATLMTKLGVSSQFQAGQEAARRGWI